MDESTQRQVHTLASAKGGLLPTSLAIVAAETYAEKNPGTDSVSRLRLWRWTLITIRLKDGKTVSRRLVQGTKHDDFWQYLYRFAQCGSPCLMVGCGIRELAPLLDLWRMVLDGRAALHGEDRRDGNRDDGSRSRKWRGYVVLESPPSIIQFRLMPKSGVITWTDAANYGCEDRTTLNIDYMQACRNVGKTTWNTIRERESSTLEALAVEHFVLAWIDAVNALQLGSVQTTAGSQAMHAYRHRFLDLPITIHGDETITKLERQALYSGRCEPRFIGHVIEGDTRAAAYEATHPDGRIVVSQGPVYHLDVNSLYPFVAARDLIPYQLKHVLRSPDDATVRELSKRQCIIARCLVDTYVPSVPTRITDRQFRRGRIVTTDDYRHGKDIEGNVIWPVGRFWTTLCGPELKEVWRCGSVIRYGTVAVYDGAYLFRRWVNELYAARLAYRSNGSKAIADCLKRILVALFGKFAQRQRRWVDCPDDLAFEPFAQWFKRNTTDGLPQQWRSFAWQVQALTDVGEHDDSFPAITAYVNSMGRSYLWQLLNLAGQDRVYYYDTDSLWVDTVGYQRLKNVGLIDQTSLGSLKVVGVHSHVTYYGIKHYQFDGNYVLAGMPRTAKRGSDGKLSVSRPMQVQSYLWRHKMPDAERITFMLRENRPYRHGHITDCGYVEPWTIYDPETDVGDGIMLDTDGPA